MSNHERSDQTEPELELGTLDGAEQSALEQALASEAADSEASSQGAWSSSYPAPARTRSHSLFDQLAPSLPPTAARGVSLSPLDADQSALTDAASSPDAQARSPSGGLISSILGQAAGSSTDEGALTALRTLPRRAQPDLPAGFGEPEQLRERMELLLQLADASQGPVRARLLSAAAELMTRRGEPERALASYEAARNADPNDRIVLRRLRHASIARGQRQTAAALFRAEAGLCAQPREQSLALCAAAELAAEPGQAPPATALREASAADPSSLLAALLLAQRELATGQRAQAAAALSGAAAGLSGESHAACRTLLWLEAGRTLEHAADKPGALACYEQACRSEPGSIGAWLGVLRSAADESSRAAAFATLADVCGDAPLSAEFARQRGLRLLDARDDVPGALAALRGQDSALGLRALARAAESAGDLAEQVRALQAWGKRSGGTERGLAYVELAALLAKADRPADALRSLRQASAARAPAELLRSVGDILMRSQGDAALFDSFASQSSDDALRAAAKLARDPSRIREEYEVLAKLQPEEGAAVTAEVLTLDIAAELGDSGYVAAALARDIARWPEVLRVGPLLAALDLAGPDAQPEHWHALRELADGQPVITRYLAARAPSSEASAGWWLSEAEAASGEHAAFAAASAGRHLELAGQDPTDAYADALDSVRGYAAGAFGLELTARKRADLDALERAQRELASTTEAPFERCARRVRLGLLNADSDLEGAARWLELAAEDQPNDAVLDELMLRLSKDQSPATLAERLRSQATLETGPGFVRALKLRAASACEDAGHWDEAIQLYRALLAQAPSDMFVDSALLSALQRGARHAELAAELERRLLLTEEPAMRTPLLEDWAAAELARGDLGRARMVLETLLEREPRHVPALRALQRSAMRDADDLRLANVSLALSDALEQPASRAAELRLSVRFEALLGPAAAALLARAEGNVHELWHALRLEAAALRSGDRTRIYDALRALSARLSEPIERAAYALRAAELLESAAPERAARELGPVLLATPEHPLAIEQLARLFKAAGKWRAAADNFEQAGLLARNPQRSNALFYAAGVLFQDELHERERARVNLQRVVERDVMFADSFARLGELLGAAGQSLERKKLLELRLAAGAEPAFAAELELERSGIALALGDRAGAKQALSAALQHTPTQPALWSRLAELRSEDAEYREAAEALVQLARVAEDDATLADALLRLASLYEEQLPDPRRAELALTRVATLLPDEPLALQRLAALYERTGNAEQAVHRLEQLIDMTAQAGKREGYVVRRANLLIELGQQQRAEQALDAARRASPASMPVLRALCRLYEQQADRAALTLHLQRSCHALRAAIELEPSELTHWLGLCELLHARQRPEGVLLVSSMARALGLKHHALPGETLQGMGRDGLRDSVQGRIAVRGALDPLRALFQQYGRAIAPHLPFPGPAHASSLDHAPHVLQAVAQLFGSADLALVASNQAICVPVAEQPLTLCVGRALYLQASDAERFFLLARAVVVAKLGFTLLVRSVPERVLLVLHALWTVAQPAHSAVVLDAQEQLRVTRELTAAIPPAARPQLAELVAALMGHEDLNPRRLAAHAFDHGARVALLVTGNVAAALHALLRLRGAAPEQFRAHEVLELCRTDPALRALLSFAISEVYLDARRALSPLFDQETA